MFVFQGRSRPSMDETKGALRGERKLPRARSGKEFSAERSVLFMKTQGEKKRGKKGGEENCLASRKASALKKSFIRAARDSRRGIRERKKSPLHQ